MGIYVEIKSDAAAATKQMILHDQKLTGKKVLELRTDDAKEFREGATKAF